VDALNFGAMSLGGTFCLCVSQFVRALRLNARSTMKRTIIVCGAFLMLAACRRDNPLAGNTPASNALEEIKAVQVENVKRWPRLVIPGTGGAQMDLKMRPEPGTTNRFIYILRISPYTEPVRLAHKDLDPKLWISFRDNDGFRLAEFRVVLASMNEVIDDKGKAVALEAQSHENFDPEAYKAFRDYSVEWEGFQRVADKRE
jgi:hypothetical protein